MGPFGEDYDRTSTKESEADTFYGYDSDDGTTSWYESYGKLDSITDTPDHDY